MDTNFNHSLAERVAVLEIQMKDLAEIKEKLDELLKLKAQGMGAISLISVLVGSGLLGLLATLFAVFKAKGHL